MQRFFLVGEKKAKSTREFDAISPFCEYGLGTMQPSKVALTQDLRFNTVLVSVLFPNVALSSTRIPKRRVLIKSSCGTNL